MKETRIKPETAKLAKEKGFKGIYPTTDYVPMYIEKESGGAELTEQQGEDDERGDFYLAPTQSLLQKWLREEHMIKVIVNHADSNGTYNFTIWVWNHDNNIGKWERKQYLGTYIYYEEALEEGILNALKLVKT